jgi:hypothetical protein
VDVLRGRQLSELGIKERMGWAANRSTTVKEYKVYCLLEILACICHSSTARERSTQRYVCERRYRNGKRGGAQKSCQI